MPSVSLEMSAVSLDKPTVSLESDDYDAPRILPDL